MNQSITSRLKARLFKFYTKRLIKARQATYAHVGFDQAQSIGILYSGDSAQKQEVVQQLATQLKQQGKRVTMLRYVEDSKQVTNWSTPTVTRRDIRFGGEIAYSEAKIFVDTPFDYLYHVDWDGHSVLDYLLAKSKAKCRVGHYVAARAGLFEIMVSLAKQPDSRELTDLTAQMLHYTQLL
ncbi:MAG: hypothetical protein AAF963_03590 [Bacteroidota bacterium]